MSPLGGLADIQIYHYKKIQDLRERVDSQSAALMDGRTNQQYLVFIGVTKGDLEKIDRQRASIGRHTRLSHYTDGNLLVIKLMPSAKHEGAHLTLSRKLDRRFASMGLPEDCLYPVGSTRYERPNSSKEGDAGYRPLPARERETDWPRIVFESGFSETLPRLRHDAGWWIIHSKGDVKIAIIISIKPRQKTLVVEKWCPSPPPASRPAARAQVITITQNPTPRRDNIAQQVVTVQSGTGSTYGVVRAPLILEFDKIMLRAPVPPNESDIIFTADDLALWADYFWKGLK